MAKMPCSIIRRDNAIFVASGYYLMVTEYRSFVQYFVVRATFYFLNFNPNINLRRCNIISVP